MSRTWTDEELIESARLSSTRIEMMRRLGLTPRGRTYGSLKPHLERLNIDLSHMRHGGIRKDPSLIFIENSLTSPSTIRRILLKDPTVPYVCGIVDCKNAGTHLGKPLTLQLDHINGICTDNRKENIRWLCPNCHSQTETYSRDVKGVRRRLNSSAESVTLKCSHCEASFQRLKRHMFLKDGYKCFCNRKCSAEFRKLNCPENMKHKKIYETFLSVKTFLGTAKLYGISGHMVKKIVLKYERNTT